MPQIVGVCWSSSGRPPASSPASTGRTSRNRSGSTSATAPTSWSSCSASFGARASSTSATRPRSRRRRGRLAPPRPRVDGARELRLVHLGTPLDAEVARFLVKLVARAPARPRATGSQAAAPTGGDVLPRKPRARRRLSVLGALLVDGASGDLLRQRLARTLRALALLDVLVLASALASLRYSTWGHVVTSSV